MQGARRQVRTSLSRRARPRPPIEAAMRAGGSGCPERRGEPRRGRAGAGGHHQNLKRNSVQTARGRAAPRHLPALLLSARGAAPLPLAFTLRLCLTRGETGRAAPRVVADSPAASHGAGRARKPLGWGAMGRPPSAAEVWELAQAANPPPRACPAREAKCVGPRTALLPAARRVGERGH